MIISKRLILLLVCLCVYHICVCAVCVCDVYVLCVSTQECQKRVSGPLELALQVVVGVGSELRSSGRAASAINHRSIFLKLQYF